MHIIDPIKTVDKLNQDYKNADLETILRHFCETYGRRMVIGTGFGPSGAVLMHKFWQLRLPLTVFYLDTNLLFRQTYELADQYAELFNIRFERVSSDLSLDYQALIFGDKLWLNNPDKCCRIRKVIPLQEYLKDKQIWVTGIRRDQSKSRESTEVFEWDDFNQVIKINPLVDWSTSDVWSYINRHDLPYNPLHDHGYPSIGCQPCTKQVFGSADDRSGRWAGHAKTECGIHTTIKKTTNK